MNRAPPPSRCVSDAPSVDGSAVIPEDTRLAKNPLGAQLRSCCRGRAQHTFSCVRVRHEPTLPVARPRRRRLRRSRHSCFRPARCLDPARLCPREPHPPRRGPPRFGERCIRRGRAPSRRAHPAARLACSGACPRSALCCTRLASAARITSDPRRRISSFSRPTALSSLSPRNELLQTSSASRSVLCTAVGRAGRIS